MHARFGFLSFDRFALAPIALVGAVVATSGSCSKTVPETSDFPDGSTQTLPNQTTDDVTTTSDSDSAESTSEASDETLSSSSDDPGTSNDDGTPMLDLKFDLVTPDLPNDSCEDDSYEFSIIWIANSGEGTVSKIDTVSAKELARYRTGPATTSDPSRTSVNLEGSVAVANRTGSITMIAAREAQCNDRNNDGKITTSTGPTNVLPWGEDECVLWHHDLGWKPAMETEDHQGGPRALAWEPGVEDPNDPCAPRKPRLWVGYRDDTNVALAKVRRINFDGTLDQEVEIPNWHCTWSHGVYGGVSDQHGNFWGSGSEGDLIYIDAETFEVKRWTYDRGREVLFYGISIDSKGVLWLASFQTGALIQFDPATEKFTQYEKEGMGGVTLRGLNVDRDGKLWVAANVPCGLGEFDTVTKKWVTPLHPLPDCLEPVGISLDAKGFVWVVDREAARAYKFDRSAHTSVQVTGLIKPYTYSDMTGYGLNLVEDPPK